ncbi:YncE family protein [Tenacibaculum agarivorans]|uniref:YncE family protein n=1 Tax=Tenacibaculum agarivorans TaxID=1908389 RepID=UPI00094BAE2F|nr:T9SS type A sorting domain-containing protein [Tenacibaculum agarivorans]
MKHLLLIVIFSFFFNAIAAQNTQLINSIEYLQEVSALKDNELYLVKQEHKNGVYSINSPYSLIKIDLLQKDQPPKTVISGIKFGVSALAFKGNELYMSLSDGRFDIKSEIVKIDVTAKTPQFINVVKNVNRPNSLTFFGNELYVLRNPQGNTVISKINVTDTKPVLTDVIELAKNSRDQGRSMVSDGTYVYVSLFRSNRIVKVDIKAATPSITDVLTGIKHPNALAFQGNELYIGFDTDDASDKYERIAKADITTKTVIATDINRGTFREINAIIPHKSGIHILYYDITKKTFKNGVTIDITDTLKGKVAKLDTSVLSTTDYDKIGTNFKLYPNPSREFIQISNIKKPLDYILYKIDGSVVKNGTISEDEKITTQMLSSGIYFIKLENSNVFRFIKN